MKSNYINIIWNLKVKYLEKGDYSTAADFREIENWLSFNSIEEVFNHPHKNEIVKSELKKLERRKKLENLYGK